MKLHIGIHVLAFSVLFGCCSQNDVRNYYNAGHVYYNNGELKQAVSCYLQCISCAHASEDEVSAYVYRDMAAICRAGGNNKMAYDMAERSVELFKCTCLQEEYNKSLCCLAIYKACLGDTSEAIMQLRYVKALSSDTVLKQETAHFIRLLQSNQLPVLSEHLSKADVSELYDAVQTIKYELYRKPLMIKSILLIVIFMFVVMGIYATRSGLLTRINTLRREKAIYRHQQADDIMQYCLFLRTHPEEIKKELHWWNYDKMCDVVNLKLGGLVKKISDITFLNDSEIRLCVLVLIDLPRNQISEILPYASNSVGKLKNTVSKKLGTNGKNLHDLLQNLVQKTTI